MAVRTVRHLGARSIPGDNAKPLALIPFYTGEDLRAFRIDAYACSTNSFPADIVAEMNWVVMAVPWHILLSHTTEDFQGATQWIDSSAEWDATFKMLAFELGTDGNEFYGGEGLQGTEDDVTPAAMEDPQTSGDPDESWTDPSGGPSGIKQLYRREVFLRPGVAESNEDVRHFDEFNITVEGKTGFQNGGLIIIGAVRYELTKEETNFNISWTYPERKAIGPMVGGDFSRVQAIIDQDVSERGDQTRTMLFGGDNYIETNTTSGNLPIRGFVKCQAWFSTPYRIYSM